MDRPVDRLVVAFLAVAFLVEAALRAPDFRVAAAFFAAVDRFADFAFRVAAAFFAAVDRLADVPFRVVAFLVEAALRTPDFRVAAAFFAAVDRLADFAFLVAAAFFAAADRVTFFLLTAMCPPLIDQYREKCSRHADAEPHSREELSIPPTAQRSTAVTSLGPGDSVACVSGRW